MEKSQAGKGTGVLEGSWSRCAAGETAASGLAFSAQLPGEVAGPTAGPRGLAVPHPAGGVGGGGTPWAAGPGARREAMSRLPRPQHARCREPRRSLRWRLFSLRIVVSQTDPAGASGTQRAPRPPPESNGATRLPSMPRRPKQGALLSPRLSPVGFVFSQVTAGVSVLFLPSKGVYLIFKN